MSASRLGSIGKNFRQPLPGFWTPGLADGTTLLRVRVKAAFCRLCGGKGTEPPGALPPRPQEQTAG